MTAGDSDAHGQAEPTPTPTPTPPPLEFVFEAEVAIADTLLLGKSKYGERRLIPITSGTVRGPRLQGEVLPGGADWQLVRADGDLELEARYPVRASDGALIQVRNRCLVHVPAGPQGREQIYVRTAPEFEAPADGPHAWLNHALFVGTLQLAGPGLVRIRVFRVG